MYVWDNNNHFTLFMPSIQMGRHEQKQCKHRSDGTETVSDQSWHCLSHIQQFLDVLIDWVDVLQSSQPIRDMSCQSVYL